MRQKAIGIINDRILGLENDLKAFIYIRKNKLQHLQPDDIGGGNFVAALSLFTALSFLGKTFYCIKRPDKFDSGGRVNETETFVQFYKFLLSNDLDLGIPDNGAVLELVWHGFRDFLAHLLVAEPGKALITFYFDEVNNGTIEEVLEIAKSHKPFEDDGHNRNWRVNCDALLSRIPQITNIVTNYLRDSDEINIELLKAVIGFE
jgi:hypothetical protein